MTRHLRTRTLLLTLTLFCCASAIAHEVPAAASFFIERIEVREAKRVSPDVVISESLLREGHEYSESDLRDAAARLNRLPFLLSAEFSLEKGSERGRHVLVISVNETKPLFFAFDARPIQKRDHFTEADYDDRDALADKGATVGLRWFVGRRGAAHAAIVTSDYGRNPSDLLTLVAGYTQYDLFGTRAFATFNLKYLSERTGRTVVPQVVLGVPLSTNQTIAVEYDETKYYDEDVQYVAGSESGGTDRVLSATWSYNTTNRPFLPTRGVLLSVEPRMRWSDALAYYVLPAEDNFEVRSDAVHVTSRQIRANAARYWELNERTSVSLGAEARWTSYEADSERLGLVTDSVGRGVLTAGWSYSLWNAEQMRSGDSRLELNARIGRSAIEYYPLASAALLRDDVNDQQISASWVRRSAWGTLRLGVGYAW